jgi:glycosyltransferase involved in cell wall biosynthesis
MISVLIPIFNTDVCPLVTTLHIQLEKTSLPFEIILLDDGSSSSYREVNRQLQHLHSTRYAENITNKGRVKTRKELAYKASFSWLLFIDSDCVIDRDTYIQEYIQVLHSGNDVIVGGTTYIKQEPTQCEYLLHWKYAHQRISTYTNRYKKNCYAGFLFNNVLIKKSFFDQIVFPDAIKEYGHEDTWVGIELERRNVQIYFINNPILHQQLDRSGLFLQKHLNALSNIKILLELTDQSRLKQHIKIYRYHLLLKKVRLARVYNLISELCYERMKSNLKSCQPSLLCFDLFRLYHLNKILQLNK